MSEQLFGRTLHWASWDSSLTITAALKSMFDGQPSSFAADAAARLAGGPTKTGDVRFVLTLCDGPADVVALANQRHLGLVLLVCEEATELVALAETLAILRTLAQPPLLVCYVDDSLVGQAAILIEAGAQIVVNRIPSLQAVLPKVLSCVSLSPQGFHPITSRLLERLPWGANR